jgi:putative flippase GtrA
MKSKHNLMQIVKFGFIGFFNTLTSYLIFSLLIFLKSNYIIALIFSYLIGVIISYYLNKSWTFKSKHKHFNKFVISYIITLLINLLLLLVANKLKLNLYLGQFFALFITSALNFFIQKYWVFKNNTKEKKNENRLDSTGSKK